MVELNEYIVYDKPVPYKGLKIYPATMFDYEKFHLYVNSLVLDKNSVPDINIISMTYLGYLFYLSSIDQPFLYLFDQLLKMVLHLPQKNEKDEAYIKYDYNSNNDCIFSIDGVEYNSNDFEEIKKIICYQNYIDLPDENIQKELRDALREAEEFKMRQNANKVCSLEDQIICVLISSNLSLDQIYNLSIRKFVKILKRIDHKMHYEIYLSSSMSGMVTFKNPLQHWMNDLENKDKYSDVKVDFEEIQNKINST